MFSDEERSDTVIDHEIDGFLSFVQPTIPLALDAKPVEVFSQLFSHYMFGNIVDQMNLYA